MKKISSIVNESKKASSEKLVLNGAYLIKQGNIEAYAQYVGKDGDEYRFDNSGQIIKVNVKDLDSQVIIESLVNEKSNMSFDDLLAELEIQGFKVKQIKAGKSYEAKRKDDTLTINWDGKNEKTLNVHSSKNGEIEVSSIDDIVDELAIIYEHKKLSPADELLLIYESLDHMGSDELTNIEERHNIVAESKLNEILSSLKSGDAVDILSLILAPKAFTKASLGRILTDKLKNVVGMGDKTANIVDQILKYAPLVFKK